MDKTIIKDSEGKAETLEYKAIFTNVSSGEDFGGPLVFSAGSSNEISGQIRNVVHAGLQLAEIAKNDQPQN